MHGPIIGERKEIFDQRIRTGNLLCSPVTVWGVVSRHSTDQQTHLNSLLALHSDVGSSHTYCRLQGRQNRPDQNRPVTQLYPVSDKLSVRRKPDESDDPSQSILTQRLRDGSLTHFLWSPQNSTAPITCNVSCSLMELLEKG